MTSYLLPVGPTRDDLRVLRDLDLTWKQIASVTGVPVRTIWSAGASESQKWVTRDVAQKVRAARERSEQYGKHAHLQDAVLVAGDYTRWMIASLHARGWPRSWLFDQMGVNSLTLYQRPKVHIDTMQKVEAVFRDYHEQWGPTRRVAIDAWRRGQFPSDCYEWDQPMPDLRPIPGSMDPELVKEACTYADPWVHKKKSERMRRRMRGWGQLVNPQCARGMTLLWMEYVGMDTDDFLSEGEPTCRIAVHNHQLPDFWLDDEELSA